jgi:hypothetical protein
VKLTSAERLKLIESAVFSVGDTLTAAEALSLIGSLFRSDPGTRINRARFAELLAVVTPARRPPKRLGHS